MLHSALLWAIPVLPLIGFLINAFLGAGLTKSPRPVVETGDADSLIAPASAAPHAPATAAVADNAGPSDVPEYDMEHGVAAAGHDAHETHDEPDSDHGAHGETIHLSPGGTRLVGSIACLAILAAFVCAVYEFWKILHMPGDDSGRILYTSTWDWMSVPSLGRFPGIEVPFGLFLDPLTSLMTLIITGVGFLIHLYSTAYMAHDKGYARYFTYLNLFVFFMLLLVMGRSLPVLFVGWEGVGLASYLLIGFWYERKSATDAAKKAFIVNRIGDCALLIGMFLLYRWFGTLDLFRPDGGGILQVASKLTNIPFGYLNPDVNFVIAPATIVPLLLFLGAAGKSAQIPLYVWLPDAMEGPTPVSALIHAATMVTGGVYLVSRCHDLFLLAPGVMLFVAVIGLATAFLAATIGLAQTDIKRVLAYSTVSQLGYMFLACGVGAFGTAMFHVTTHAFFKALLFLGSGSVIHAMSGEQDMNKMGGLGPRIPKTWATMLIGTLAIAGIPPLAGFWSKDEILLNAFAGPEYGGLGNIVLWAIGVAVAAMTAFYMVRLMMKTFAGRPRFSEETAAHIHESPPSMLWPLYILAALSIVGGFLNAGILHLTPFETFLGNTVDWRETAKQPLTVPSGTEMILLIISAAVAILFCVIARQVYAGRPNGELVTETERRKYPAWGSLRDFLYNKWGVDEFYQTTFVKPGYDLARGLWRWVDTRGIDGAVSGTGKSILGLANGLKGWQSGYVRNYAFGMLVGVVLVVVGCLIGLGVVR